MDNKEIDDHRIEEVVLEVIGRLNLEQHKIVSVVIATLGAIQDDIAARWLKQNRTRFLDELHRAR